MAFCSRSPIPGVTTQSAQSSAPSTSVLTCCAGEHMHEPPCTCHLLATQAVSTKWALTWAPDTEPASRTWLPMMRRAPTAPTTRGINASSKPGMPSVNRKTATSMSSAPGHVSSSEIQVVVHGVKKCPILSAWRLYHCVHRSPGLVLCCFPAAQTTSESEQCKGYDQCKSNSQQRRPCLVYPWLVPAWGRARRSAVLPA